ncbi:MAG: PAS domain-containing sensor histidine kinase [Ignavibacteria bacterium]|nr:PAS domain-containing sensor histidine kinase [Ignavibacteria bacterium]
MLKGLLNKCIKNLYWFAIIVLIVFVAFGVKTYFKLSDQLFEQNINRLINSSQLIEVKINMYYDNIQSKLFNLPKLVILEHELFNPKVNSIQNSILDEFFQNYFEGLGLIKLLIVDESGKVLYDFMSNSNSQKTLIEKINFDEFKLDSVYLGQLYYDVETKTPVFEGKILFLSKGNKKILAISKFNARKQLYEILEPHTEKQNNFEALLLQVKDGITTYLSDSKYLGNIAFRLHSQSNFLNESKKINFQDKVIYQGNDYRGNKVFAYLNHLPKWDWYLVVKTDQDNIIGELKKIYIGIFGTILGVTITFILLMTTIVKQERKKFELEKEFLQKQKELIKKQYDNITKIANDAIIITDSQNRIIDFNDKFIEFYKISNPENFSLNFYDYLSDALKEQWQDYLRSIKENNGLVFEAVHKTATGEVFNVQVSAKFIDIEGNEYLIQIIRDFEERKRIEDELRASKQKAEESDKLKSNFLSMMSHEVRTPINIILGALDILKSNLNEDLIKKNEHLFDMISRNGRRLLTLISDIIDISRIESNELKLEFIIRNVESLILDVVAEYEQVAKNKGLEIVTNFKATNPYVRIDEVRFLQIISNLISNAIKFTSQGGITITTENFDDTIHISVKDTGIGIPKHALNEIFKMFRQAHEGYGRNYEGAGLGLTITQKLTKMMGGEITVESEVNRGSTFTLIFPTIQTDELDENLLKTLEEKHKDSYKPTILIVNNDKDEMFYLETLMIRLGFEYFTINEGKKIVSFIKHKPVDCVIYSVSIQNELEVEKVMEEIRYKIKLENLKMIALRSPNSLITEERLLAIGFNLVKTTPVSFEDISTILYKVLSTTK